MKIGIYISEDLGPTYTFWKPDSDDPANCFVSLPMYLFLVVAQKMGVECENILCNLWETKLYHRPVLKKIKRCKSNRSRPTARCGLPYYHNGDHIVFDGSEEIRRWCAAR